MSEPTAPGQAADPRPAETIAHQTEATDDPAPPEPADATVAGYPFLGPPAQPGDLGTLGPYRVTKLLGEGGMGFVFRGEDDALRRPVALKVMRPEIAARPLAKERFLREGRAAAAVKSDHVTVIYQVGEASGVPFLAMEFLDGATLDDWLKVRGGAAPPAAAVRVAKDALKGLAAAHEKGLVHRDVKPANLWVESPSGKVKVLDFGLTRGAGDDDRLTRDGAVVGTPSYMAPEQARGETIDARTDLFSLGTVLYRMLAGRNPFAKKATTAALLAVTTENPPPLMQVAPGTPPDLSELVARLMAKDPAARPADARAALAELGVIERRLKGEPTSAGTPPTGSLPVVVYAPAAAADPWAEIADESATAVAEPVQAVPASPQRNLPVGVIVGLAVLVALVAVGVAVVTLSPGGGTETGVKPTDATAAATGPDTKAVIRIAPATKPAPDPLALPLVPWMPPPSTWKQIPVGQSPLDKLDPARIPEAEKFPWQPKELVTIVGRHRQRHWGTGFSIALSPKGDTLATSGQDYRVRLWNSVTLTEKAEISSGEIKEGQVSFSPDGRWLAVSDYRLLIWVQPAGLAF